jgi:hypothetical protein
MSVSSSPRGEHPGRPGANWDTELVPVEVWVPDDSTAAEQQAARPNRATRRRLARETRRTRKD